MKRLLTATAALALFAAPVSAFAQNWNNGHDDHRPSQAMQSRAMQGHAMPGAGFNHANWRKGGKIERNDWNRGQRVNDWQNRHLQRPPRGYEWRQVDNNYVLAAVATGLIASIILANH